MIAPFERQLFRPDTESAADVRAFEDRDSYQECHRSWALTGLGGGRVDDSALLVRVVDYVSANPGFWRKFLVRQYDDALNPTVHYWEMREDTLVPVDPSEPNWRERWLAERAREALESSVPDTHGTPPPPAVRL